MKKTNLRITLALFLFSCFTGIKAQITGTVSIGTGSSTTTGVNWHPIYRSSATSTFDYSRAAYLYDAAELVLAGIPANATITAIEWDKSNTGATVSNTAAIVFNILMKNSAAATYTGATAWSALSTGATAVYATTAQAIPATVGNLNFSLSTPFVYTGGALEILTDWDISAITGNPTTGGISWNGGASTNHVLGTSAGAALTGASSLGAQTSRPNIRIIYSYIPLPNDVGLQNLTSPITTGCYGASENVIATLKNFGGNAQSNIPVTVIVSGAVSQTLNTTFAGPLAAGATATVNVGTLNMTAAGTYSFNGATSLAGDGNNLNDAMPSTTRNVVAPAVLPQMVNFNGFTGANLSTPFPLWSEATGSLVPTGNTSVWLNQTGVNGATNVTARINLYTTTRNEWIVGPKFTAAANSQLSFDAAVTDWNTTTVTAVMGSDDKVRVMVSTDCGGSFAPIFTVSATNSLSTTFTNFTVSLAAYAGQDIIVAFLAQDGPTDDTEDYDFHLDNINIVSPVATDAGATALVSPALIGCYGSSENMVVTINNFGSSPISNVPVTVIVSGAATQTSNAVYSGTIAPGASVNFTVATLNMTAGGTYSFNAFTSLAGDGNTGNDAMVTATRTKVAPVSLPQTVDFTGFTGANLPSVFSNWVEGAGATAPTGTTSLWLSQTGVNSATNTTARINLYTTTRNEWIVGPKVSATANTQLTFDAAVTDWNTTTVTAVMGSDDKVRVMVSTDCGLTYSPIFTVSATNSLSTTFTNFAVSLGAYAGQDIIVAFLAQDGPTDDTEDYDFHLDNINLCTAPSAPASPLASAICTGTTTTINSTTVTGTPHWYNVPTGGSAISTSTMFTTPTLTANTTYYLADSTGCGISPRTAVTITVSPIPTVSVATTNSILCTGSTATLTASGATTYSWSGVGAGATVTVSPTANTVYTVTGSNPGCSNATAFTQSVSTCTGIESVLANNNGVMLYPNPSTGAVNLVMSTLTNASQFVVYDALGKIVFVKEIKSLETNFDISELKTGIYIYRVNSSSGIVKQGKLVKQ